MMVLKKKYQNVFKKNIMYCNIIYNKPKFNNKMFQLIKFFMVFVIIKAVIF